MPITKDVFVRGFQFDGATGLHTGEQLEDLVTKATPANGSEMVDQETIETYLDAILNVYRLRVKDGSITEAKIADGAITNAKLAEGFTMIKSVQRGTLNITQPATAVVTVTAVDPLKSFLIFNSTQSSYTIGVLTNATTLTFTGTNASSTSTIMWQLIEYI